MNLISKILKNYSIFQIAIYLTKNSFVYYILHQVKNDLKHKYCTVGITIQWYITSYELSTSLYMSKIKKIIYEENYS